MLPVWVARDRAAGVRAAEAAGAQWATKDDPRVNRVLEQVKEREALGYAYEGADASFFLLARKVLGEVPEFFTVESFRVLVERRYNAAGEMVTVSEATVKVNADGEVLISVGEGNGPVNALDAALRAALLPQRQRRPAARPRPSPRLLRRPPNPRPMRYLRSAPAPSVPGSSSPARLRITPPARPA